MLEVQKDNKKILLSNTVKDTYVVQKSRPFFSLWQSKLTLVEFKILDIYLSKINSHHPETREVEIPKYELEKLFGVKRIKKDELDKRLRHLMSHTLKIKDSRKEDGFALISLFSKAICKKDECGVWNVKLSCTPEAMEYIFNIESLGYLRYKIKSIMQLQSLYSYILFMYIEYNRFRKTWTIELENLKQILDCENTYSEFKRFNNLVLKKSYEELTKKTELRYTYKPIRVGRKVRAIEFNVETINDIIDKLEDDPPAENNSKEKDSYEYDNLDLELYADACNKEFNNEEMHVIYDIVSGINVGNNYDGGIHVNRYHFIKQKYSELKLQQNRRNIKHPFSYFKISLERYRDQQNNQC